VKSLVVSTGLFVTAFQAAACPTFEGAVALYSTVPNAPQAFISLEAVRLSEPVTLGVEFCLADQQNLTDIRFDAIMPAHQHGLSYRADVFDLDGSSAQIGNIVFHMPGIWELQFEAKTSLHRFPYTLEVQVD
jgi:hypothetical protein